MNPVTVLIPIGPQSEYLQWLPEAIESVLKQTMLPSEVLVLSDGADITLEFLRGAVSKYAHAIEMLSDRFTLCPVDSNQMILFRLWKSPWNIGFAQIFNCGVGLADNDLIIYLASDDRLMDSAIKDCLDTWENNNKRDAWYSLTYQLENGEIHTIPINAAMITRNLWKATGGFPPAAFAGPDAALLSCLMAHASDRIIKVEEGKPNYWIREHPYQETKRTAGRFSNEMTLIRGKLTAEFSMDERVVLK